MTDSAIPAATLILVREPGNGVPEILMVERAGGMAFAAGAWVFPGGRIDESDRILGNLAAVDPGAVAAIRETLEETAVPAGLSPTPDVLTAQRLQDALASNDPFADLLGQEELSLDGSELTLFARWMPKFHAVRKFDTFFFLARCPEGDWTPRVIEGECSGATWMSATELLERDRRGEARLIFPTRRNLERLAQHSSFEQIRADALAHPVETITPWVEERNGEQFITIPDHLGYPVTQERLSGLWRG